MIFVIWLNFTEKSVWGKKKKNKNHVRNLRLYTLPGRLSSMAVPCTIHNRHPLFSQMATGIMICRAVFNLE